jgi:hypothetical protein
MSIFFELPGNLRGRWWNSITLEERETIEKEYRETTLLNVPVPFTDNYKEMTLIMAPFLWIPLKDGLIGEKSEQVDEAMKAYLSAYRETNKLHTAFEEHNENWGKACVPNTDTKRVADYWEGYGRLQGDIHYAEMHEQVLYDELLTLIE